MKIKEPYSTIIYIIFGILLAFGINTTLAIVAQTDLPIVAVESDSMNPTFYRGDILFLQGQIPYQLSDVIVFSHSGGATPVVHRIIAINGDGSYQTKGDANKNQLPFEKEIQPGQVHGKVILIVPYLGWVKIGMSDFILPNIVPLAGVVIFMYIVYLGTRRR